MHTFDEKQREEIIKQLCDAMKQIYGNIGKAYDWIKRIKENFISLYEKAKEINIFDEQGQKLLDNAYSKFGIYLKPSNDIVLIHNDLHFDNIFFNDGKVPNIAIFQLLSNIVILIFYAKSQQFHNTKVSPYKTIYSKMDSDH